MTPFRFWGWGWQGLERGGLLQAGRKLDFESSQARRSPEDQIEDDPSDSLRTQGMLLAGLARVAYIG